jgi:type VI secretion system protein ImpL
MKRVLRFLLSAAVLGTLAVLGLSAIVWWVGPLVAIGSAKPLAGFAARLVVVLLLWAAWIGRLVFVAWRRKQANAALLHGMGAGPSAADQESQVLAQRFREAVAQLKTGGGKKASLFSSGDTLYDLPWYVFVGAPGSGKTTALLHAGLNFVLGEGQAASVKGVGGTRNCDWWFTRDAVLIDTAGRYALQESDAGVDAAAWDSFLSLLRRTRPRRPINGVLLTINVQDLLQQAATERQEHAAKLRARLHELQTKLGVRAPVYVLVTKADLIAGFNETFETLGKEERDQVWGFSFPAEASDEPLRHFDAEYAALEQRLNTTLVDRLQAERDVGKRAAIFGFTQEFANLKGSLSEFLGQVFGSGGPLQDRVLLRGVYFTSGTQEGTPIDRVMGQLTRSFGLERAPTASASQRGKSFFLRRLLQDLVFPEAHLVSFNPKAEARRRWQRVAGFSAVGLLATVLLVGWAVSYSRNKAYEQTVAARLPALKQAVDALPPASNGDPLPLVPTLSAVQAAAQPAGFAIDAPPLLDTLGLYQGDKLDAGAQLGYHKLLQHGLAPRVARRLEERLRAANKDNLEQAYEALKSYLMLYTPDKFDADTLRAWIALDWDTQFKNLAPEQRAALDQHLDAMLALGAPPAVAPMDKALVASVRDMLASFPLEYRIYSRLKRQFRNDLPEFSVAAAAGPNAPKVFERASGEPLSRGVPGFYTRDGYIKAFQGTVAKAAAQLGREQQWVLNQAGSAAQQAAQALGTEVAQRVRRLYLEDYVKVWDAFLADVRLVKLGGTERSMEVARILSGVDSPLAAYLRAVSRETTLVPPPATPNPLDKVTAAANQAKNDLAKLADPQAAPAASGGPIEKLVDDHFAALRRQVEGQPAPIDDVQKLFGEVYAQLQAVDAAQKSKSAPPAGGSGDKVKVAAAQQPEPIRSMLTTLADAGATQGRAAEREAMTGELKPIYDFCTRAIANRYPFASGSKADVLPEDFGQLFGAGGMLDDFYQRRLANLVDTGTNPWTYKPLADGSRPAAPATLAEFQRAARIKEAFFRSGGKAPGFRLDVRAAELAEGLKEVVLDIDGQITRLTPGSAVTIAWPSQRVASQIKLSTTPGGTPLVFDGPWALFRLFDRFEVQPGAQPEKFSVVLNLDGKRAKLDVIANSVLNPFRLREIQQFRCPGAL